MVFLAVNGGLLALLIILGSIAVAGLIFLIIFLVLKKQKDTNYDTQRDISDKDLLALMSSQPDGMMNAKRLAQYSSLTTKQAKNRLSYLFQQGLFKVHYGKRMEAYYSLIENIDERPKPTISNEPFLTVSDVLTLIKFHGFRLTYQNVCMSTGLPISVIKEELDYFIKEGILTRVGSYLHGQYPSFIFLLQEPYRSNPDMFLKKEETMNLDLEKIYVKERKEQSK